MNDDEEKRVVLLTSHLNRLLSLLDENDEISFILKDALEPRKKYRYSERDMKAAEKMYAMILVVNPRVRKPVLAQWADTLRIMHEQDKVSYEDMGRAFVWANSDRIARGKWPGWAKIIQSASGFREHYPKICEKMDEQVTAITAPPTVPLYQKEIRS